MATDSIALLIDGDNLRGQAWSALLEAARKYGRVAVARLYTDFQTHNDAGMAARAAGLEPVHVLGKRSNTGFKSMVDVALATDGMQILYDSPAITCLIVGSGDADFMPLLRHWKRHGKRTIVMSNANQLASELRNVADDIIVFGASTNTRRDRQAATPSRRTPTPRQLRDAVLQIASRTRLGDRETNQPIVRADWVLEELQAMFSDYDLGYEQPDAVGAFIRDEIPELEPIDAGSNTFLVGNIGSASPQQDTPEESEQTLETFAELCREVLPADGGTMPGSVVYNEGKRLLEEGMGLTLPPDRPTGWFRNLMKRTAGVEVLFTEAGQMEFRRVD